MEGSAAHLVGTLVSLTAWGLYISIFIITVKVMRLRGASLLSLPMLVIISIFVWNFVNTICISFTFYYGFVLYEHGPDIYWNLYENRKIDGALSAVFDFGCTVIVIFDTAGPQWSVKPLYYAQLFNLTILVFSFNIVMTWYLTGCIVYRLWSMERETRSLGAYEVNAEGNSYRKIIQHDGSSNSSLSGCEQVRQRMLSSLAASALASKQQLNCRWENRCDKPDGSLPPSEFNMPVFRVIEHDDIDDSEAKRRAPGSSVNGTTTALTITVIVDPTTTLNAGPTGRSDIPLTENGIKVATAKAPEVVGHGKMLDPDNLCHIFISPRQRAQKTFELLFDILPELPPHTTTEEVREWDYGDYEGFTSAEIDEKNPGWSIWRDGCPGGESVEEMCARVDGIVAKVHELHRKYYEEGIGRRDCMIVAHGHFSRVLIARWVEFTLRLGTHFNVEPAGIAILSYNHHSLKEPALNGLNLHAMG
ncbi:hypothetical protein FRB96_000522 [Tulasnella sp. 330]|nr:hypothetical protein FRB96_000522 [Tulasnella sp. 330]